MTEPCTIRIATPDDSAAILACLQEAFAPYRDAYPPFAAPNHSKSFEWHRLPAPGSQLPVPYWLLPAPCPPVTLLLTIKRTTDYTS